MNRTVTRLLSVFAALLLLLSLPVTAYAAILPGTAQCTITPTDTKVSGDTVTVTYSITVTPPEGQELGVFSVQLQPSDGMALASDWVDSEGNRVIDYVDNLAFNEFRPDGAFATYGYTPQTGYFAAAGTTAERRMSQAATILTIQATIPADKAGTYTLGAEFIAALDGSGDVYTARVVTTPVSISSANEPPVIDETPVITENGADAANTGGSTADGSPDAPSADSADTAEPGNTGDGADASTPGDAEGAAPLTVLWILLAVAAAAIIVVVVVRKKKASRK